LTLLLQPSSASYAAASTLPLDILTPNTLPTGTPAARIR
jgi:hypothetical protein